MNGLPIEPAFSFADEIVEEVTVDDSGGPATYSAYQSITDDTGAIVVEVPVEWSDIDPSPIVEEDGSTIPYIAAATSIDGFINNFTTSGMVFVKLEPTNDIAGTLNEYGGGFADACTDLRVVDYSDLVFVGRYQVGDSCGGTESAIVVLAAVPEDGSYTALDARPAGGGCRPRCVARAVRHLQRGGLKTPRLTPESR